MSTRNVLKADSFRRCGYFSYGAVFRHALTTRTYRAVVTMRLCQIVAASNSLVRLTLPLFKVLHKFSTHIAAVDLPWESQIDGGLAITHGRGLVVNQYAKIGSNVTLFHGVTIGRSDHIGRTGDRHMGFPVIEDEVWIGPYAIIAGDITIGRGSRIAGGSFVIESVPPYSIVSGNPATILKTNCMPDVMNPAPEFAD